MENKLEQLLNSLIEKGWRIENQKARIGDVKYMYGLRELRIVYETDRRDALRRYPIRFLVSKDSNLWQFVCENMLINKKWFYGDEYCIAEHCEYTPKYYKFRLIETALTDEDKLEQFLLDNIKIDVESK